MSAIDDRPGRGGLFAMLLVLAATLGACAAPAPQRAPTARFSVNGALLTLPADRLQEMRRHWNPEAGSTAARSHSDAGDHQWILDFIAVNEALGTTPCEHLTLERIEPLPLAPITVQLGADFRRTFVPKKYKENRFIGACGVRHRWAVVDDSGNPANELTVLLFPVAAAHAGGSALPAP